MAMALDLGSWFWLFSLLAPCSSLLASFFSLFLAQTEQKLIMAQCVRA